MTATANSDSNWKRLVIQLVANSPPLTSINNDALTSVVMLRSETLYRKWQENKSLVLDIQTQQILRARVEEELCKTLQLDATAISVSA